MLILTSNTREFIKILLYRQQNHFCNLCKDKLHFHYAQIDHIIPRTRLIDEINILVDNNRNFNNCYERKIYIKKLINEYVDCMNNLQLVHDYCNQKKKAKIDKKTLNEYLTNILI